MQKKKVRKVLLDMDGVLTDLHRYLIFHYNRLHIKYTDLRYGIEELFGMSEHDFWEPLKEDFWANLPKTKEADFIVQSLEEKFGRDHIAICTSPVRTAGCAEGKLRWVREHFPQYARQFMITPVKEWAASPTTLLVDDFEHNRVKFEAEGGLFLTIPRPWNKKASLCDEDGHFTESYLTDLLGDYHA